MSHSQEFSTDRLRLRRWVAADATPFAAMNADPQVVQYLSDAMTREASDAMVVRIRAHFEQYGFGLWAVEVPGVTQFAGYVGLSVPQFEAHFTPCVEIAWRLGSNWWGNGYATEGARAVLAFGFDTLELTEIVSFTVATHWRSRRVMERIGMTHDPKDDFDHPNLPAGHPLRRHVLYRISR